MVSWSLYFEFGLELTLGLELGLQFGFSLWLGLGLGIFTIKLWRSNKLNFFQIIKFYSSLYGNKARTEFLLLPVTRARLIYLSLS